MVTAARLKLIQETRQGTSARFDSAGRALQRVPFERASLQELRNRWTRSWLAPFTEALTVEGAKPSLSLPNRER